MHGTIPLFPHTPSCCGDVVAQGELLLLLLIAPEFETCELLWWSRDWCHLVHGPLCCDLIIGRAV